MAGLILNISINPELSRFGDHNIAVLTLSPQAVKMPFVRGCGKGSHGMLKGAAMES